MAAGNKKTAGTHKKSAPQQRYQTHRTPSAFGLSRDTWAMILGALGLISVLSLFPIDGFLLQWLRQICGAAVGLGRYLLPFSLLGMCVLLLRERQEAVRLRSICILLLPVLLGSIIHGIFAANRYSMGAESLPTLIATGIAGQSGGILGGGLYLFLEWAISSIGAMVLLIFLAAAAVMVVFQITPLMLWDMIRPPDDDEDDYDEEWEDADEPPLPTPHAADTKRKKRSIQQQIDIPIDDTPVRTPLKKTVQSPAEYLEGLQNEGKRTEPALDFLQDKPEKKPKKDAFGDILHLMQHPQKQGKGSKKEQAADESDALAAEISASQQTPLSAYIYPPLSLLQEPPAIRQENRTAELADSSQRLVDTLDSFGIHAKIINIVRGPSVTRFELTIERGVKFSRITALSEDIALSLGAMSVRIAPIPDKMAIGIEVPNKMTATVYIREVLASRAFQNAKSKLSFAVGKDITGASMVGDIGKMPHMLIAGTTGSGKSVCINSMLISLLYKSTPEEVRLILVDPKMVELGNYNGIPHLLIPVVTDPKKASGALNWAVGEMERRYQAFAEQQVRDLAGYNAVMRQKKAEAVQVDGVRTEEFAVLPQIVIVIDELADLMMVAAKEIETSICRIAQKARAAGMHLIVATQRPSADVITGIMKANIPSRIAFAVASQIESRIILDQNGAEKLIGKGDMLYAPLGNGKPTRVQGCFISSDEIEAVIAKVKESAAADYSEEILQHIEKQAEQDSAGGVSGGNTAAKEEDPLLMDAVEIVLDSKQASVSMLQRRLKLGYSRAARIVDQMEERGIVGPFEGSKPRQILISREQWQEMQKPANK